MIDLDNTIVAISTAAGAGAIAVIRLTGPKSVDICKKVFVPKRKNKDLKKQETASVHFGSIVDNGVEIDEVLVSLFLKPNSFTGEDTVEISCHGAPYIQQKIIEILIKAGAKMAQPGEFTQRAFLNGKMDLSQAEAVADLISSQNEAARKVALQQMKGGFSNELTLLRNNLLHFISLIELELDFSEEDVEFADRKQLLDLVNKISDAITKLISSFSLGNAIKNGVPVVIAGQTNTGKSTLLNAILKEDKAIVSNIHGTTRDVIEDTINIEGITFRFIDTAGIRQTDDTIENIGIERTFNKIESASVVLLMLDVKNSIDKMNDDIMKIKNRLSNGQKLIVLINKIDLDSNNAYNFNKNTFEHLNENDALIKIAAKEKINLDLLFKELISFVNTDAIDNNQVVITNARHFEALSNAHDAIVRVINGLETQLSADFIAQDIRECLHYLGEITGAISTDEVLGNIFKNFCIGK